MRLTLFAALGSAALALAGCGEATVVAPDAGGADSGPADAGSPDAGRPDSGGADAGGRDSGSGDAGPTDGGLPGKSCPDVAGALTAWEGYETVVACLRDTAYLDSVKRVAVGTFVASVEAGEGFPIANGDEIAFVYVRDGAYDPGVDPAQKRDPIYVAGDFNLWSATQDLLAREGESFFHRALTLPGAAGSRWGYKFVAKDGADADVWFSDPLSRRFDYDQNGRISLVRGGPAQGHLEWIRSVHATQLGNDRAIYLYVPPGYEGSTASYPVLYMHDGNNLFDPQAPFGYWNAKATAEAEIGTGRVRAFVLVGIANTDRRIDEYTHAFDASYGAGGEGDQYADFVLNDLKPLVDGRYRTLTGSADTAILGSSLGGLISYAIGLWHPEAFKYVGGMSSTFWWGTPTMVELYAQTSGLAARGQVYYLDSGGGPPGGGCTAGDPTGGDDDYCGTVAMQATLEAAGIDVYPDDPNATTLTPAGIRIFHWWEPGAQHNEAAWSGRLFRPLRLFFRP